MEMIIFLQLQYFENLQPLKNSIYSQLAIKYLINILI